MQIRKQSSEERLRGNSAGGRPLTVTEITRSIKRALETEFSGLSVAGELSNVHRHTSGHLYFTLKDEGAQLAAVMFRASAAGLFFQPQNGMEVICRGSVTVYEPRGNYQLVATAMQPRGEGALQAAFEKLKQRLRDEGLFDEARKRPLPPLPRRVALVTSPTGAAIRDLISVIGRRDPSVRVLVVPVQVQGAGAAESIAAGIDLCNEYGGIDVIVAGRGGGSMEDLWAFNEEIVARAIVRSRIPVVSAVGHEVDFTIADFAADLRAATPSAAAEIVVPASENLIMTIHDLYSGMRNSVDLTMTACLDRLNNFRHGRFATRPLDRILQGLQQTDDGVDHLHRAMTLLLERRNSAAEALRHRLAGHDAARILRKGFVITRKSGTVISSIQGLREGDEVSLEFHDGRAASRVTGTETE